MPRGSNSEVEQGRIKSKENSPGRATKSGTGVEKNITKTGFGRGSMQKNPSRMPRPGF